MALPGYLEKVLKWLQAGYPEGIPRQDYFPLLAFLARGLKADEVSEVVSALQENYDPSSQTTSEDVRAAIEAVTNSPALEEDVRHIQERLGDLERAGGI